MTNHKRTEYRHPLPTLVGVGCACGWTATLNSENEADHEHRLHLRQISRNHPCSEFCIDPAHDDEYGET